MAMSDDEIKAGLAALLARAHKRKSRTDTWFAIGILIVGFFALGTGYGFAADYLGFGDFGSVIISIVTAVVALCIFAQSGMTFDAWRARRWATEFRKIFAEESGDYARAVAILRASRTESKAEKDLQDALDKVVTFDAAMMPKKGSILGGGLLGGFGKKTAPTPKSHSEISGGPAAPSVKTRPTERRPDYVPLDPYSPAETGSGSGRPG